jgi:hypothetical protein
VLVAEERIEVTFGDAGGGDISSMLVLEKPSPRKAAKAAVSTRSRMELEPDVGWTWEFA